MGSGVVTPDLGGRARARGPSIVVMTERVLRRWAPIMTAQNTIASVSVDLDAIACYWRIHALPGSPPEEARHVILRHCLPRFAELFDEAGVKATFFVVGGDLRDDPEGRARLAALARTGTSSPTTASLTRMIWCGVRAPASPPRSTRPTAPSGPAPGGRRSVSGRPATTCRRISSTCCA